MTEKEIKEMFQDPVFCEYLDRYIHDYIVKKLKGYQRYDSYTGKEDELELWIDGDEIDIDRSSYGY